MHKIHLLLFLFFIVIISYPSKSGYQNNIVPEFEPDDTQFMICQNSLKEGQKVKG